MNEPPPLRLDARSLLEATLSALAVLMLGINNVGLDDTYALLGGLVILAAITFISRILGKNATDAVNELKAILDQALARNNVLVSVATPTAIRKADEAAASIGAPVVGPVTGEKEP